MLNGVSARSGKDVWAVGAVSAPAGPLAVTEHWDGLKWTVVKTGLPTTSAILNAVAAPPGGPSVAVGYHLSTKDTTLILRNAR